MNIPKEHAKVVEKYCAEIPVRLGALAAELGLEVFKSTMKPDYSGLIEPSDTARSGFRIKINRHEMTERQRFTLAHEIAHFLLHRQYIGAGVVDSVLYRSALSDRKEVEANKLASALIMPEESIRKEASIRSHLSDDDKVVELARLFRVSQAAMRIKLGI